MILLPLFYLQQNRINFFYKRNETGAISLAHPSLEYPSDSSLLICSTLRVVYPPSFRKRNRSEKAKVAIKFMAQSLLCNFHFMKQRENK